MEDSTLDHAKPRCTNWAESWYKGHWRDWHRGHGCNLDDGKPRAEVAQQEIDAHAQQDDARRI